MDEQNPGKKSNARKSGGGKGSKEPPPPPQPAGKKPISMFTTLGKRPTKGKSIKRSLSPPSKDPKKPVLKRRASEDPSRASKRQAKGKVEVEEEEEDDDDEGPPVLKPMVDLHEPLPLYKVKTEDVSEAKEVEKKASPIKFPQRLALNFGL